MRQEAAAQAAQLGFELVLHGGHGEHVLAGQKVVRLSDAALRAVGHGDRAVVAQVVVAQAVLGRGQRVVRRDRVHEAHLPQRRGLHVRQGDLGRHAQRQVGLAADQRLQRARERFRAQLQAGRRAGGVEGLAELEQRAARHDRVGGDGELRFPAGGHALDALGHGVQLVEQVLSGPQQLGAGGGELGAARAAVEQQHVQRVFDLAHPVGQGAGHHAQLARRRRHAAQPCPRPPAGPDFPARAPNGVRSWPSGRGPENED